MKRLCPAAVVVCLAVAFMTCLFAAGCGGNSKPAVSVTLSPSSAQTIDQGQSVNISATVANDSSGKGVTWNVSGGGSLANQTATSAAYDTPASVTSPITATITATSVADTSKTATLSITVNALPSVTTASLPNATAGAAYSQTLAGGGGTAPLTWSISVGALPNGLTLNSSTGAITGTPTGAGTTNFTVQVSDAAKMSATKALSIIVGAAATLSVTTTSLPAGTQGAAYSQTLQATGGVQPYSWSVSVGSLPAGLSLAAGTGVISGTPTATGTSNFTVMVTDSGTPTHNTGVQALSITINAAALSITNTSLPNGTNGIAYSATLQASGGVTPYTWSISTGSLPSWATLNASTGQITGTPNATGTTNFTVQVADSETPPVTKTQALSITVNTAGANNSQLKGQYAFLVQGIDVAMAASFTADGNGNITAGTEDLQAVGVSEGNFTITTGTYSIGSDERGTLTFTDSNSATYTFAVALGSISSGVASKGAMTEFDTNFETSGSLALQNSAAFSVSAISGGYAFGFPGWDGSGNAQVIIGSFTASAGTMSNGLADVNDAGSFNSTTLTGTYGSVNATTGRGTMTVTPSGQTAVNFAFYVVSASQLFVIQSGTGNNDLLSGQALQQSGGPYSLSSLNGNMIFVDQSQDGTGPPNAGPNENLGIVTASGNTSFSFSFDQNQDGTVLPGQTGSGTIAFTSSANGRFTATPSGGSALVGYMIAPNEAFVTGTSNTADFGTFEAQAAGPFSQTSLSGQFFVGTLPVVSVANNSTTPPPPLVMVSGVLSASTPNVTGTLDGNSSGTLNSSEAITDTYTIASNGRVTTGSGKYIGYIVSSSKIYLMAASSKPNPTILVGQQ